MADEQTVAVEANRGSEVISRPQVPRCDPLSEVPATATRLGHRLREDVHRTSVELVGAVGVLDGADGHDLLRAVLTHRRRHRVAEPVFGLPQHGVGPRQNRRHRVQQQLRP